MKTDPDLDLARSVRNMLWWAGYWRGNEIGVRVERGSVTLSGEVEWEYQKRAAVPAIQNLTGIVGITDDIVIKFPLDKVSSSRWS